MASNATVTVRPAIEADLDSLSRLLGTQLREHAIELPDDELKGAAKGLFHRPQAGRFLVAVDGTEMIGFAALSFLWTLERGGRAAWLDELYVVPERRGAGIGKDLLDAAIEVASAAGCRAVDLEIDSSHQRAASLYVREGFRELGRTRWAREIEPAATAQREPRAEREGGCFCGEIRYRMRGAIEVVHCHCSICRRTSGAPVVPWATIASEGFEIVRGQPAELRATSKARRTFCGSCGTPLTFQLDARAESIDVTVASLDDPGTAPPVKHTWTSSRIRWFDLDDDLPRHEREDS